MSPTCVALFPLGPVFRQCGICVRTFKQQRAHKNRFLKSTHTRSRCSNFFPEAFQGQPKSLNIPKPVWWSWVGSRFLTGPHTPEKVKQSLKTVVVTVKWYQGLTHRHRSFAQQISVNGWSVCLDSFKVFEYRVGWEILPFTRPAFQRRRHDLTPRPFVQPLIFHSRHI